jgi:hypothetical protein
MNKRMKQIREIILIPVEYILFWEILFLFWWVVLMAANAPREFHGDWNFIIFIAAAFSTVMTPGLSIIEVKAVKWVEKRSERLCLEKMDEEEKGNVLEYEF